MMTVKTFQCNMLQENCYVLSDDTNEAVIIDCGAYYDTERQAVVNYLLNQKLTPIHLLCTHGHFDHCFGNDTIFDQFGLKPEVHANDEFLLHDLSEQVMNLFGSSYHRPTPPIGHFLSNNETVSFGNHKLKVLHTPGHTPGGMVFYCAEESVVFTGDTLFRMSVGRTDFERGSWEDLLNSLQTVVSLLPNNTTVYPGHGPITNIADEKQFNPYMRSE